MNLFDSTQKFGTIRAVGGDADMHRRLVDMGLLGSTYCVRVRKRGALLVDYGDFCAVTDKAVAERITVKEL